MNKLVVISKESAIKKQCMLQMCGRVSQIAKCLELQLGIHIAF